MGGVLTRPLVDNRLTPLMMTDALRVDLGAALSQIGSAAGGATMGRSFDAGIASDAIRYALGFEVGADISQESGLAYQQRQGQIARLVDDLDFTIDRGSRDDIRSQIEAIAGPSPISLATQEAIASDKMQSPETLNEKYADLGVKFDYAMSNEDVKAIVDMKRAELIRNAIVARSPTGLIPTVAKFGAGLWAMATDPLEVATMFIPVVGPAARAVAIGKLGRVGGRVAVGAVEGGVGQALTEPAYYGLSQAMQLDYDMSDSLLSVGLGFAFGGGIGSIAGALSRRHSRPDQAIDLPEAKVDVPAKVGAPFPGRVGDTGPTVRAIDNAAIDREVSGIAFRQVVNDQAVDLDGFLGRSGYGDAIKRLTAEWKSAAKMPLVHALRSMGGVHPDGVFGRELKSAGMTSKSYPGLFSKHGIKDVDVLEASSWDAMFPGLKHMVGGDEYYLDSDGFTNEVISEFRGASRVSDRPRIDQELADIEHHADVVGQVFAEAKDLGFRFRSDDEVQYALAARAAGKGMDDIVERLAIMSENEAPVELANRAQQNKWADQRASDEAGLATERPVDEETAELETMIAQIEHTDRMKADIAEAAAIDQRVASIREVIEAAAACLARV